MAEVTQQSIPSRLVCHPAGACPAVREIHTEITHLPDGGLQLAYRLTGKLDALIVPGPCLAGFTEGLWSFTCFEAFIATEAGSYREFNFSPSGQWAVFAFRAYRERDTSFVPGGAPKVELSRDVDSLELVVSLPASLLPLAAERQELKLGLSAVIEASDGNHSYWALVHPAEKPDFHDASAFCIRLKSAE